MNPSASGWIKKLQKEISLDSSFCKYPKSKFYNLLRDSGFIYGSNIEIAGTSLEKADLSDEEICKVNLF